MAHDVAALSPARLAPVDRHRAGNGKQVDRLPIPNVLAQRAADIVEIVGDQGGHTYALAIRVAIVAEFDGCHAGGNGWAYAVCRVVSGYGGEIFTESDRDLAF